MKIYITNMGINTKNTDLSKLFSSFGSVISARVIVNKQTGTPRRSGFVEMSSEAEAISAIEGLNNKEIEGRILHVSAANENDATKYTDFYKKFIISSSSFVEANKS